ncbi:MAG: ATP-binding protein [Patescibacteria group bacterium]
MNNIPRYIEKDLTDSIVNLNKVIIIYGARRVGKTTLVEHILKKLDYKILYINGDEIKYRDILSSGNFSKLDSLTHGYELIFIDEAQRIKDIGINLKILVDKSPDLKIVVTGSSSVGIANSISESLAGRDWVYNLYPISFLELSQETNNFFLNDQLEERLIFGSYPEIFSLGNSMDRITYLKQLSESVLYKDIFELQSIKHHEKVRDLLKLLSFQVGSEVSINELSNQLSLDNDTISRYIDLLEKSFIIFRLHGLSKNLRKEVRQKDKIYFYDNGIRNAIIDNFKFIKDRDDIGKLWENFLISERIKLISYKKRYLSQYFLRTYTKVEIDYIEDYQGTLSAYEIKWGDKMVQAPRYWKENYPKSNFSLINKDTYIDFITK